MWCFTTYGFISAVCGRKSLPGGKGWGAEIDPTTMMIRSRSVQQLENLRAGFAPLLDEYEVKVSKGTDYHARLIVPTEVWVQLATALASEVDYGNFKNKVSKADVTEPEYRDWLGRVWSAGFSMQQGLHPRSPHGMTSLFGDEVSQHPVPEESSLFDGHEPESFVQIRVGQLKLNEHFLLVEQRVKDGPPQPKAVLVGYKKGLTGREIVKSAANDYGAIEAIPKARLKTTRGVWGDPKSVAIPQGTPVFDLLG